MSQTFTALHDAPCCSIAQVQAAGLHCAPRGAVLSCLEHKWKLQGFTVLLQRTMQAPGLHGAAFR